MAEMTIERAKSELMQIYGALSPDKQRAIDTLVKIEPCEDAISRKAILEEFEKDQYHLEFCKEHHIERSISMEMVRIRLHDLPSVNPQEPKTGHWIPSHIPESILSECSECGFSCGAFTFNYCPNCGAKMESEGV